MPQETNAMRRNRAVTTLIACLLCGSATAWLGSTSGLFTAGSVGPQGWLLLLGPYLVLALITWLRRRDSTDVTLLLTVSLLVGVAGLSLLFSDWYSVVLMPRPTHANPWRPLVLILVVFLHWPVVALVVAALLVRWLWRRLPLGRIHHD
jgi:hypothetical protein